MSEIVKFKNKKTIKNIIKNKIHCVMENMVAEIIFLSSFRMI